MARKREPAPSGPPWVPPQEFQAIQGEETRAVILRFKTESGKLELRALRCWNLLRCPSCESTLGPPLQFPRTVKTCPLCRRTVWCIQAEKNGTQRWFTFHPPGTPSAVDTAKAGTYPD